MEGVADYAEKTHARHRDGLYLLGEELHKWIGVDTYDYLSSSFHLPKGPAKKVIPRLATELRADLVVMGTIARTGISGLIIGNTAEAILDQLSCSVLAIKPPEFKTPVKVDGFVNSHQTCHSRAGGNIQLFYNTGSPPARE